MIFLQDAYQAGEPLEKLRCKLHGFVSHLFDDSEQLIHAFSELHSNVRFILEQMQRQGIYIRMEGSTGIFASWFRDAEPAELKKCGRIHFLWSCLDEAQRQFVLEDLHDVLLERNVRLDNRIAIITCFHDELLFVEPEKGVERRTIAALFNASVDNECLNQWLDHQSFTFSSWSPEDARTATTCIINNQELFPKICETSQFIKNRLPMDKKNTTRDDDNIQI
ncbi:hypothetical protein UXO35_16245 [Enterobacter kobei]|uniref:hypothetical protein n=1 Tax=Enterobacter kobei TaxID=208224 RepID=UPI002FD49612